VLLILELLLSLIVGVTMSIFELRFDFSTKNLSFFLPDVFLPFTSHYLKSFNINAFVLSIRGAKVTCHSSVTHNPLWPRMFAMPYRGVYMSVCVYSAHACVYRNPCRCMSCKSVQGTPEIIWLIIFLSPLSKKLTFDFWGSFLKSKIQHLSYFLCGCCLTGPSELCPRKKKS
jgi:hypothetical protein